MQYISPLALIDLPYTHILDRKTLTLAKKKMLAELELNGGEAVVLNGRALTKNDIIVFFDTLQKDDNLHCHITIAADAALLNFLENNTLKNKEKPANNPLYHDSAFIEWLSPYFFTPFTSIAKECLTQMKDEKWALLMAYPLLMNAYYTAEAWNFVEEILHKKLDNLYAFRQKKGANGWEYIEPLVGFRYISMLKRLPEQRFYPFMDEYARVTMHCAVYVYNKISRSRGTTMVENALLLVVSDEARTDIVAKHVEMEGLNRKADKKSRFPYNIRRRPLSVIYVLIVAVVAICNAVNDDSTDTPAYMNTPYNPAFFDSIKEKLQKAKPGDTVYLKTEVPPPQQELPTPTQQTPKSNHLPGSQR